ncbi:MAG: hypothetical protein WCE23_13915 [Candidatus Binatus sp.]|uniref:hypothetical protein n=1 Tax=Candidatus Binatus sp. TaxID=2811406 RepID=UPI003C78EABE
MAIFTKQFADTDEYEQWLQKAGERISVLSITNAPARDGSSTQPTTAPIGITYETDDQSLAPARSRTTIVVQAVIIGVLFFALFIYLISKI